MMLSWPIKNPFRAITLAEHMQRRTADAMDRADHHARKAIEAQDAADWAAVKAENHKRLAAYYRGVASTLKGIP